ncbi:hypothetical protein MUG78_07990 [Gordonia alkaliphila]|uniref:hypothetical protein n=1 Tax=Gordonia alkaliphila TaxID=1053547 RepID=UPI001FF26FB2|nr:hypothetical protein [Gordonia alkaliphila]MCK0439401.1 hypothetical protein [Gordonia alkaliphila]
MTTVYFVIAALALIGAGVLLWLDHNRSQQVHHQRAVWGQKHSFKFRDADSKLLTAFHRAAMDVPDHVQVRDVAYGLYAGAEAVVFDLAETATVVAVRRPEASSVSVDLRYEDVLAPAEGDLDLLGAMGSRVMFASNLDAARRICDRRMVALATEAPSYLEIFWNEGNWALGSMPLTTDDERLDVALDTVRRFADLLRVLPPAVDPQDAPAPRDPHGPISDELADEKTDALRDKQGRGRRRLDDDDDADGPLPAAPYSAPTGGPRPSPLDATPRPRRHVEESDDYYDAPRPSRPAPQQRPAHEAQSYERPAPQRPAPMRQRPTRDRLDPPDLPPRGDTHPLD